MTELTQPLVQNRTTVRAPSVPLALRLIRAGLTALSRVSPATAALVAERIFLKPRRHPRPAHERAGLRSARPFTIAGEDGALSAWEWGTEGPRVLLVHGWEGRGSQLGELVPPLLERGFRVVAFDMPGHGDSPGSLSSFFHFARSIVRTMDVVGPVHAIIAHSMGGASTAWALRNVAGPKRLVMIAPPADIRDFTGPAGTMLGLNDRATLELERRLGRRFGVPMTEIHATLVAAQMTTPLLVVHDETDREVPISSGELVAGAWPGAVLERTRGLGHRRILRDARVIDQVTAFATGS
jgi:pimeloyl-ACP methyl ester carboxylesterase